mgnify:FL=1
MKVLRKVWLEFFHKFDLGVHMNEDMFCGFCDKKIWYSDVFCMRCGEPNPFFRLDIFKAEHDGKNVMEKMIEEGCRLGHPGIQKDIAGVHRDIFLEYPYCSVCGANLVETRV